MMGLVVEDGMSRWVRRWAVRKGMRANPETECGDLGEASVDG